MHDVITMLQRLGHEATRRLRPRRALFYGWLGYLTPIVPGSDDRKIQSSFKLRPDCLVYDLEDSVPLTKKGAARQQASTATPEVELAVRMNAISSGLELQSKKLQTLVVPKVNSAADVQFVNNMINCLSPNSEIQLVACIESGLGVMNLSEIARQERVNSLLFAAEDYCADVGITRTSTRLELLYARSAVVAAAAAYNLQSIDLVCIDYTKEDVLTEECVEGKEMGFTGKQAIHPRQIDIIQRTFYPSPTELENAQRIVDAFELHAKNGVGAFSLDDKVVDMPVVRRAIKILQYRDVRT